MLFLWCAALLILSLSTSWGFNSPYPKLEVTEVEGDAGVPLILTPLIERGKIKQARSASEVRYRDFGGVRSYSGYFTVDKQYNSNLFFWFFPNRNPDAPLLLWLQGGPGASSLFGLFEENGPFFVRHDRVKLRPFAWTKTHSVLYIDNPVGTGFSFTNGRYATNETTIGEDLYVALLQFFSVFPEFQKNDFYVTGESYAGKYVPALGYTIYRRNRGGAKSQINLQGLAIGNGWSDPINQYQYAEYLYQIGLLDKREASIFKKVEDQGVLYIKTRQWKRAFDTFSNLLDGNSSLFRNFTGFSSYYNLLYSRNFDVSGESLLRLIRNPDVRRAIHVGNIQFGINTTKVQQNLQQDSYQSVAPWVSELLSNYRVLIYTGQLDIIVAYPLTENYLSNLNFTGAAAYRNATRYQWRVGPELAGYVKHAGNLTEVLVRDAGHMVPKDQPIVALDLITRFTHRKSYV